MRRYFERFLSLCDKQIVLKKKHLEYVSMQVIQNTSSKGAFDACLHRGNRFEGKAHFQGETMVLWELLSVLNVMHSLFVISEDKV